MSYRNYTNEDIINKAKEVKSIAGLLRKLNLKEVGGNYYTIKRKLQQLNVDTVHLTGRGWNNGERLKDWGKYTRAGRLKPHLIKERGHSCEHCDLKTWQNKLIPLELHHQDKNRANNNKDNLKLLCPNCHSLTPRWRGRLI